MGQLTRNEVFTLAVQKYSDAVYRAAIHNSRCTADAEDVVQDVYEKLLHYNGTFESEEHLKAWLLRVAINRCRDLTRAAHQKDTELDENLPAPDAFEDGSVLDAVRALPENYRNAIYLLPEPVKVSELPVLMGERFEVLVEVNDNKPFDLVTLPVSQMGMAIAPFDKPHPVMRIQPIAISASGALPDTLSSLPALPSLEGLTVRKLQLSMDPMLDMMGMQMLMEKYGDQAMAGMDHSQMMGHMEHGNMNHMNHGGKFDFHHANKINGQAFDMNKPMFAAAKGQYERWVISGVGDMMLHPFHIHGTQFRILSENGKPPAAHRAGWKDTVKVEGNVSEVLVKFNHDAPKEHAYMAHCHLLEHEDTGMMLGFTV
mgnify:CR=1 FL=1